MARRKRSYRRREEPAYYLDGALGEDSPKKEMDLFWPIATVLGVIALFLVVKNTKEGKKETGTGAQQTPQTPEQAAAQQSAQPQQPGPWAGGYVYGPSQQQPGPWADNYQY